MIVVLSNSVTLICNSCYGRRVGEREREIGVLRNMEGSMLTLRWVSGWREA